MSITTNIEDQIAAISAQHKADAWGARQEAARQQQADAERQRVERNRANRIAQLQAQLKQIPARLKQASTQAADADELAGMFALQVDHLANVFAMKVHAERNGGRPVRLELGSPEAHAYFHGAAIKKHLRQLALTANNRSFGAPLIDAESFASELREEEKRLRSELAELQLLA